MLASVKERGMATAVPSERRPRLAIAIFFSLLETLSAGTAVVSSALTRCFRLVEAMEKERNREKEIRLKIKKDGREGRGEMEDFQVGTL